MSTAVVAGRGRVAIAVLLAVIVGVVAVPLVGASPASAVPIIREPTWEDGEFVEPWEPPVGGFEWAVPSRFGARLNGVVDYHWDAASATYIPTWVHVEALDASFRGCPTQAEEESNASTQFNYRWELRAANDDRTVLFSETKRECLWTHRFALDPVTGQAAPVFVRLSILDRTTGNPWAGYPTGKTFDQQIVAPKDMLIVSLGDSYGSGEGNPDVPQALDGLGYVVSPARWVDERCHRSAFAAPAQAALEMERSDPHSTVTFLSFACSGATISKEYWADQSPLDPYRETDAFGNPLTKPAGTGVLGPYVGAVPTGTDDGAFRDPVRKLPSQVDQLETALTTGGPKRSIAAMLLSGGGNDLGFGPLAAVCTLYWECPNHEVTQAGGGGKIPLSQRFDQSVAEMPARYAAMKQAFADKQFSIGRTYMTQYPDPTTTTGGAPCSAILDDVTPAWMAPVLAILALADWNNPPLPPYQMDRADGTIGKDELQFAATHVMAGINGAVGSGAQANGWTLVSGIADSTGNIFAGHGYCSADSWIRRASDATRLQGPSDDPVLCNPATFWFLYVLKGPVLAIAEWALAGCIPPATAETKGTLHPTAQGHAAIARKMVEKMRPDLLPLPPPGPPGFNDTRGRAQIGTNGWLVGKGAGTCPTGVAACVPVEVTVTADPNAPLSGVSILRNGSPVPCSTAGETSGGVRCQKVRSTDSYKWKLTFLSDGIFNIEFAALARSGATTTFSQEYKVDLTDPASATTTETSARPANGGWYRDPVDVAFGGRDAAGGSGINGVEYTVDNGPATFVKDGGTVRLSAEGVHTVRFRPVDLAGRMGAWQPPLTVRIDATAPSVACGAADGTWHGSDATVACTATDGGSGVAGAATFNLATAVAAGTETTAAETGTQQACDVAGNCATAGPVGGNQVDKRPPSITVTRPAGSYYIGQAVTAAYSCADGGAGVASGSCTGTVANGAALDTASLGAKSFTVDAADAVGNVARETAPYTVTRHVTSLTYLGDTAGDYHDPVPVAARLLDTSLSPAAVVVGEPVTFTLGSVSCTASTDADGRASCTLVPDQAAGPATLQVSSPQTGVYEAASLGVPFTVEREQVTVASTGPTVIPNGRGATLSAVLREEGVAPVAGRSVVLRLGQGPAAQSCTGATNAAGVATCSIANVNQPLGPGTVTVAFAGDGFYEPASASTPTLVFAFLSSGAVMVGPQSAIAGARATVLSPQWAQANALPGGEAPAAFKGFASGANPSPACGASWTADPAASGAPPSVLPAYVGVAVTPSAPVKVGNMIQGTANGIVVVRMDESGAGTGTVVATYLTC